MTRDDIIKLAREADLPLPLSSADIIETIEFFAGLVAAREREACADICDQHATCEGVAQLCAEAIRARGRT